MKNTYQELELLNGEKVKLTLNFARLLKVKSDNPQLYDRFMKVLQNKDYDIVFDSLTVVYIAYLCANIGEETLTEDELSELIPFDLELINTIAGRLIQSKKK